MAESDQLSRHTIGDYGVKNRKSADIDHIKPGLLEYVAMVSLTILIVVHGEVKK